MLAGEMSECTSRIQGGLVGWVERGQMAPMFEQAAFDADIGELVRAETHFGLHLIKVEAERYALAAAFDASIHICDAAQCQAALAQYLASRTRFTSLSAHSSVFWNATAFAMLY